jgi:hypothetical protein
MLREVARVAPPGAARWGDDAGAGIPPELSFDIFTDSAYTADDYRKMLSHMYGYHARFI